MSDIPDAKMLSAEQIEVRNTLLAAFGPILKGGDLVRALGFESFEALRQARRQKRLGIPIFAPPARRGLFAYTCDVADWIHGLRERARSGDS